MSTDTGTDLKDSELPTPSSLNEKVEFLDSIIHHVWKEWSCEYIKHTKFTSPELLREEVISNHLKDNNIPMIYVIYKPNLNVLVGFCFIDVEDTNVMTFLTPWLANVFIVKEFRGKGFGDILLRYVTSLYSPLYLWTDTKSLVNYYAKFGFEVVASILEHGELSNLTVMKKETQK